MTGSLLFNRLSKLARVALAAGLCAAAPRAVAIEAAGESGACSLEGAVPATVAAVDDDFSLLLDDGRRAALSGVEFPTQADLRAAARKRLQDWLAGRDVFLGAFSSAPDRWGRIPARLFAAQTPASPLVSVAEAVLAAGDARVRPDPPADVCARAHLAAEAAARQKSRGLWALDEFRPLDAGNRETLLRRKGMVLVEGLIRSIGQSEKVIYLNFGEKRAMEFSVVILRRNLAMFTASGIDPLALTGRRARVRGLIEAGVGPRIEISTPAEIELVDETH